MKKADRERIERIKNGPCMACLTWARNGQMPGILVQHGCDAHHLLSGGRRRGHDATIALCPWHHRAVATEHQPAPMLRGILGPSLMDGSKVFREAYGTDEELLRLQSEWIAEEAKHDVSRM